MGADRKGPLAAFVVVAIIAAILLVTSVRSQAAPGWIGRQLPAAVAAVSPPSVPSDLWATVGGGVGLVVRQGDVLVTKTIDQVVPSVTTTATPPENTAGTRLDTSGSTARPDLTVHRHGGPGLQPSRHSSGPRHHGSTPPSGGSTSASPPLVSSGHADHGLHRGWTQPGHHSHQPGLKSSAAGRPAGQSTAHGQGHAHGHSQGHSPGHSQGQGHAYGHGEGHGHGDPGKGHDDGDGHNTGHSTGRHG